MPLPMIGGVSFVIHGAADYSIHDVFVAAFRIQALLPIYERGHRWLLHSSIASAPWPVS